MGKLPTVAILVVVLAASSANAQDDLVKRGVYLLKAGGCITCYTAKDGKPLAGGRALKTPFGTFFSPNITPDTRQASGAGAMSNSTARFTTACGRTVRTIFRCFPIRPIRA